MHSIIFNFFNQSISPGIVKTEFFGRASKADDIEKAVESTDDRVANVNYTYVYIVSLNECV